jgi:hypothetical protein
MLNSAVHRDNGINNNKEKIYVLLCTVHQWVHFEITNIVCDVTTNHK